MLEVRPGLLLGSAGDAMAVFSRMKSVTKVYNVTHVLTVDNERVDLSFCTDQPTVPTGKDQVATESGPSVDKEVAKEEATSGQAAADFKTKFVCLPDLPSTDLLHHFESCCHFVKEGVQNGTVLVHCQYGISRSVTVVLAYLMWSEGRPFKVVHDELKEKKPEIRPNTGFIEQLKLWEAMRCKIDGNHKLYKAYRLKHMAREMKDTGIVENLHASPDPFVQAIESTAYYKCRKCRRLLFTDESVLPHVPGKGQSAFKWHKRSKPESTPDTDEAISSDVASPLALSSQTSKACSSFFLEPLQWMESALLGTVEGKILCPKCNARLGSFNWSGEQCSCGQWVTPSFQIHRARVDETRTLTKRKNVPKQT